VPRPFAPLLLLLPAACASLSSGVTQSIDVATDPPGATCLLTRNGAVLGVVSPTPGSLTVGKSSRAIDVDCTRDGHDPASVRIEAGFQLMTAGNILSGGLLGVAVDAGTGAMHRYPGRVSLPLAPIPDTPPDATRGG
jgi:hypothetical protein